jgi:hypothetical protein
MNQRNKHTTPFFAAAIPSNLARDEAGATRLADMPRHTGKDAEELTESRPTAFGLP